MSEVFIQFNILLDNNDKSDPYNTEIMGKIKNKIHEVVGDKTPVNGVAFNHDTENNPSYVSAYIFDAEAYENKIAELEAKNEKLNEKLKRQAKWIENNKNKAKQAAQEQFDAQKTVQRLKQANTDLQHSRHALKLKVRQEVCDEIRTWDTNCNKQQISFNEYVEQLLQFLDEISTRVTKIDK